MNLKKYLPILIGAFVFQIFLFVGLYMLQMKKSDRSASEVQLITSLHLDQASDIKITDHTDQKSTSLKKVDGKWVLPEYFDFPVSETKMKDVINQLAAIKVSWPVGQTIIAAKQFHTVEDQYEKKIEFLQDGKALSTLYFGTSPTFKKLHIRVDGSDQTYSVDFNSYDLPSVASGWANKKYYEVPRTEIASLSVGALQLTSQDAGFTLPSIPEGFEMDQMKVDQAIAVVSQPDFEEVLKKSDAPISGVKEEFTYKVMTKKQEEVVYTYYAHEDKEQKDGDKKESEFFDLKISTHPYVFKVRRTRVFPLLQITESGLIKKKVEAASSQKEEETKKATTEVQG